MAKCRHGYRTGSEWVYEFGGSSERKIDRHEAKCRRAHFVAHPGFLGKVVCCVGCGTKVL